MKKGKRKNIFKENIKTIIIVALVIVVVAVSLIYNKFFNYKKTYTVTNGTVEKVSDTYVYVLKDEKVIDNDKSIAAIPIIEQDKRASKGEVIAIYKNSNYDKYQEDIAALDKEIQTLVNDLPAVYSSDINTIDSQISTLIKEAQGESSYVTMQEYKNKVNELLSKKINILGKLSPAGSKIRELIEKREKLEKNSKNSGNNIKAPKSGLVTYKIDGLETLIDFNKVSNYDTNKYDEIISKYSDNSSSDFGVKIVDNFKCYYLTKEKVSENAEYMKEGRNYQIKLMNKSSDSSAVATLVKSVKSNDNVYNLFSIENNIADVLDVRQIGAEIIWTQREGLVIPLEAVKSKNDISYITIVTGGEYLEIPIKINISNDTICIAENYTNEELEALGIKTNGKLQIYDQIIIDTNNK